MAEATLKNEKKKIKIQQKHKDAERVRQMGLIENVVNVRGADAFRKIQKKHAA